MQDKVTNSTGKLNLKRGVILMQEEQLQDGRLCMNTEIIERSGLEKL